MISEIQHGEKKNFPKLMKRKKEMIIILFDDDRSGTVVFQGAGTTWFGVGAYISNWNMDEMEDFYGKITLSN